MRFPFYIAWRYLFSKKSRNVINLITGISVGVIAFVTAAMIVVLSAFNGIDELVDDLYSSFDGDVIITPERGRSLSPDSVGLEAIMSLAAYGHHFEVIEQNVLLTYGDQQRVASMKGVPDDYMPRTGLDSTIYVGSDVLQDESRNYAILGYKVMQDLDAGPYYETLRPLTVHAARKGKKISRSKERAFRSEPIPIGGGFSINMEYDTKFVLVPISFAQGLMDYKNECNSIEIIARPGQDIKSFRQAIAEVLPDGYVANTRFEKNAIIYKANESERLVTIMILSFIILIAVFNILASLTMLMLDKSHDLTMLHSMGAPVSTLRRIFFIEGLLISGAGMAIGLALGAIICYLQQEVGLVPLEGGIVDYYPVLLRMRDFGLVAAIVMIIAVAFSWIPVNRMTRGMLLEASDRKR